MSIILPGTLSSTQTPEGRSMGQKVSQYSAEMWEHARKKPEFLELSAILKSNLAWQENLLWWKNKFILKSLSQALTLKERIKAH